MLVEMVALLCVSLVLLTTSAQTDGDEPTREASPPSMAHDDDERVAPGAVSSDADASPNALARARRDGVWSSGAEPETLEAAVLDLLAHATSPARIAVLPVVDDDAVRAKRLAAAIARTLVAERLEAVTEKSLAVAAATDDEPERASRLRDLAIDHALLAEVRDEGGVRVLDLRLIATDRGNVVARSSLTLTRAEAAVLTTRKSLRGGIDVLVDEIAIAMERVPGETRYQRLALMPLQTSAFSDENKGIARTVERELGRALVARGFLVVERTRLDDVIAARESLLDDAALPELSRAVDAQATVTGTLAPAGDNFVISVRVVSALDGTILGTGSAEVPRAGAIALSSDLLETRTPSEAIFRSAVAPGWGQFYNREPIKGSLTAIAVFGLAGATVFFASAGVVTRLSYELAAPLPGEDPASLGQGLKARREAADVMLLTAVATGLLTTLLWSGNVVDAYLTASE
jgi:TolB-like protein